jgi:pre-rRNA-processing protein TSR1
VVPSGVRRFPARPIFSQASPGSLKQKYERYLHGGSWSIASVYAHVTFPPSTVLLFNADPDEPEHFGSLMASGNLATVSPDRIILKRIVLTGFPIKVHKKTAVIRYMFYNPEDVKYFKPVQLHTKYGRTGHIVDSVGTHGSMKCQFDRPMTQMDTVCMPLYKRVYPKWPEWCPNWLQVPKLAQSGPVSVDAPRVTV